MLLFRRSGCIHSQRPGDALVVEVLLLLKIERVVRPPSLKRAAQMRRIPKDS
jgi:hypothetical protein